MAELRDGDKEWRLTPEAVEDFRKEHLMPELKGDAPWIAEQNRVLNALCWTALDLLKAPPSAIGDTKGIRLSEAIVKMNDCVLNTDASGRPDGALMDSWTALVAAFSAPSACRRCEQLERENEVLRDKNGLLSKANHRLSAPSHEAPIAVRVDDGTLHGKIVVGAPYKIADDFDSLAVSSIEPCGSCEVPREILERIRPAVKRYALEGAQAVLKCKRGELPAHYLDTLQKDELARDALLCSVDDILSITKRAPVSAKRDIEELQQSLALAEDAMAREDERYKGWGHRDSIIEEVAGQTTLRRMENGGYCWVISDIEIRALKSVPTDGTGEAR